MSAIVIGIVGGVALWLLADKRYDDAVADLAPAPIGCDTTLVFDRVGTYTFFVETKGQVGEIDGDCDTDDRAYDLGDDEPPEVGSDAGRCRRAGGRPRARRRADLRPLRCPGDAGSARCDIEDTGDYVLTADADASEAMIRVGRDPSNGVTAMRAGALAVLVGGVVVGVLVLVLAQRRARPTAPAVAGPVAGLATRGSSPAAHGAALRQPAGATAVRRTAEPAGGTGRHPARARRGHHRRSRPGGERVSCPAVATQSRRMTVTTRP